MFCYIKTRKAGTINWKALREDGKILVFNSIDSAKKHTDSLKNLICEIITLSYHPAHKKSQVYGKKYKKIGW